MKRVLVLSDIHAFSRSQENKSIPSYVDYIKPQNDPEKNPLRGLERALRTKEVPKPDMILVGGDLGHRADPNAIESVWQFLQHIKTAFDIPYLLATAGNHDVDSRYQENKFDPRGFLQQLSPSFPFPRDGAERVNFLEYWAHHFSLLYRDEWRVLTINSCAYHGGGPKDAAELVHGRISEYTVKLIDQTLSTSLSDPHSGRKPPPKINICLLHHHLKDEANESYADLSAMKGASDLIKVLSKPCHGQWIVVHGHRHRSDLYWAGGNTSGPLVLSSGSFAATREGDLENLSPNQFHLIEFTSDPILEDMLIGTIRTWTWRPTLGWASATLGGGLPELSGFGFRSQPAALAPKVKTLIGGVRMPWADVTRAIPELKYLIPSDLAALLEHLSSNCAISSEPSVNGFPSALAPTEQP